MLLGAVHISAENLSSADTRDISHSLRFNSTKLLSLRGCRMTDRHFERMMTALAECESISQLNLNHGVLSNHERVTLLASALQVNKSLTGLFLHGSPLGDEGLSLLIESLCLHPGITSLDLGDCCLGDQGIRMLSRLLPDNDAPFYRPGLKELTVSANPAVTSSGWAYLALTISSGSCLRVLNVDYNRLGDTIVCMLASSSASCKTLEVLDLENVGMSDQGARVILTLVSGFSGSLTNIVLTENNINTDLEGDIAKHLNKGDASADSNNSSSSEELQKSVGETDHGAPTTRSKQRPRGLDSRRMRRVISPELGSSRYQREQLRSVERTAMRLLKRTKSSDSVLLKKTSLWKRLKHEFEDSDSCEEELSLYFSNMNVDIRTEKQNREDKC